MAVKPILLYPDPLLKRVAPPVLDFAEELHTVLKDLEDTLDDAPYCVGIAATQIAALTRVLLIDVSRSRKPVPNQGRLFLINPVIVESSGSILGREGCLSMDRQQLFQRYSQGVAGKNYNGGSGLGLYLSKQIVEAHQGSIICQSVLGKGSCFIITLPLTTKERSQCR